MVSLQYGLVFFSFISIVTKVHTYGENYFKYCDAIYWFFSVKYSEVSIYVIYIYVEPLWKVWYIFTLSVISKSQFGKTPRWLDCFESDWIDLSRESMLFKHNQIFKQIFIIILIYISFFFIFAFSLSTYYIYLFTLFSCW